MMFSYVANPDGFNESGLSVPTALSNKVSWPSEQTVCENKQVLPSKWPLNVRVCYF